MGGSRRRARGSGSDPPRWAWKRKRKRCGRRCTRRPETARRLKRKPRGQRLASRRCARQGYRDRRTAAPTVAVGCRRDAEAAAAQAAHAFSVAQEWPLPVLEVIDSRRPTVRCQQPPDKADGIGSPRAGNSRRQPQGACGDVRGLIDVSLVRLRVGQPRQVQRQLPRVCASCRPTAGGQEALLLLVGRFRSVRHRPAMTSISSRLGQHPCRTGARVGLGVRLVDVAQALRVFCGSARRRGAVPDRYAQRRWHLSTGVPAWS